MPTFYYDRDPDYRKVLVHEAPPNEKTKKLHEKFKIDESGYPECYKWRDLAKLGKEYEIWEPFEKLDEYKPGAEYPGQILLGLGTFATTFLTQAIYNFFKRKPWFGNMPAWLALGAVSTYGTLKLRDYAAHKTAMKHAVLMDYAKKHPERFGMIYRPKYREVIIEFKPTRV